MEDFTEIIPGLFMGGTFSVLMPNKFDAIVDCRELSDLAIIGVPYLHIPMIDGPLVPAEWMLNAGYHFVMYAMEAKLPKILVHCAEGHNRSGLVVADYLIHAKSMPAQDAIDLIRLGRPGALSNQVFVNYLLNLQEDL